MFLGIVQIKSSSVVGKVRRFNVFVLYQPLRNVNISNIQFQELQTNRLILWILLFRIKNAMDKVYALINNSQIIKEELVELKLLMIRMK